uniref:G_PROTEIN_RECEP_F1_2 domain-containing protein n=1 Tax=Parastrongyloides trichosuri TaxID=131310 RepID=A0A0N4ZZU9_PARTI
MFGYKHWYSDEIYNYLDMTPQNEKKNSKNRASKGYDEIILTINLMFHTVFPFILLIYANLLISIPGFGITIYGKTPAFETYGVIDIIYRFLSPITMIIFMDVYRNGLFQWFGINRKVEFIKSSFRISKV